MSTAPAHLSPVARRPVPPLENGDSLTREEFERRYDATPGLAKAELIEGMVHVPPLVSSSDHGQPHFNAVLWLGTYAAHTPGVVGADNASVRLDRRNMPQPDVYLMILPEFGGRARIDQDGYTVGLPELLMEVSASSATIDLHSKLELYRRHAVPEYVVWRTYDRAIDYFVLSGGDYVLQPLDGGRYKSATYPGLWLDADALLRSDLASVLRAVQEGIASPEHAAFVEQLRQREVKP